jgi:hypothetical protein
MINIEELAAILTDRNCEYKAPLCGRASAFRDGSGRNAGEASVNSASVYAALRHFLSLAAGLCKLDLRQFAAGLDAGRASGCEDQWFPSVQALTATFFAHSHQSFRCVKTHWRIT